MKEDQTCFHCEGSSGRDVKDICGYPVCEACIPKLGLYKDATIRQHKKQYDSNPETLNYREEIEYRLRVMEQDYIKTRIKLLYVLERLDAGL